MFSSPFMKSGDSAVRLDWPTSGARGEFVPVGTGFSDEWKIAPFDVTAINPGRRPSVMLFEPHLCYITDRQALDAVPLLARLQTAVRAGVDLIQLREKDLDGRQLVQLAGSVVEISASSQTRIVINDRLDVAMAAGAHGVHLGVNSVSPEVVRRQVGKDFLIGVSCHSLEEALTAEAGGADYILLGPIFDTPSKRRYGLPLSLDKLSEVTRRSAIPVLALGGISVERVKACLKAGATGVAGIRLFQECASLEERIKELRMQFV
jgi:thiamine-phosphate pyrophosphorylase